MTKCHFQRWITCTPMAFRGDEKTFFSRDSGFCCRALQTAGCEAKVVMPEPAWDDEADVMRAPYAELSNPEFWRSRNVEAIILYSWADPKYTPIAEAIRSAGIKIFLMIESTGLISPFVEPITWFKGVLAEEQSRRGLVGGWLFSLCRLGWQCLGLHKHFQRLRHMAAADVIGVISPIATERVKKYTRFFRREDIARKVRFVPHPVDSALCYTGVSKEPLVITVGRWDDAVKRPEVMVEVAAIVLNAHATVKWLVVGKDASRFVEQIAGKVPGAKDRLAAWERLHHDVLCDYMSKAQVSLCTSRKEGYHTVSAEALLCGCSVVAPLSPYLPSLPYFVENGHFGRLAANNPAALGAAVLEEVKAWAAGQRDPFEISRAWRGRLEATGLVECVDSLLSEAVKNP